MLHLFKKKLLLNYIFDPYKPNHIHGLWMNQQFKANMADYTLPKSTKTDEQANTDKVQIDQLYKCL